MTADQDKQADIPVFGIPGDAEGEAAAPGIVKPVPPADGNAGPESGDVSEKGAEAASVAEAKKIPEKVITEDENGSRAEATFLDEELNGESKIYDADGNLIQKAVFAKGVLNGPLFAYDSKGHVVQKAYYLNGKLNGEMTLYDEGRMQSQFNYKDDCLHGKTRHYSEIQEIVCVENYKNGEREGVSKYYDRRGNQLVKAPYKAGKLHGMRIEYYTSGDPRERAPYKNDLLEGEVRRYYMDGTIMQKVLYHEGKQIGDLIEYDQDGNEQKDSWWVRLARWIQGKKKVEVDSAEGSGGVRG